MPNYWFFFSCMFGSMGKVCKKKRELKKEWPYLVLYIPVCKTYGCILFHIVRVAMSVHLDLHDQKNWTRLSVTPYGNSWFPPDILQFDWLRMFKQGSKGGDLPLFGSSWPIRLQLEWFILVWNLSANQITAWVIYPCWFTLVSFLWSFHNTIPGIQWNIVCFNNINVC